MPLPGGGEGVLGERPFRRDRQPKAENGIGRSRGCRSPIFPAGRRPCRRSARARAGSLADATVARRRSSSGTGDIRDFGCLCSNRVNFSRSARTASGDPIWQAPGSATETWRGFAPSAKGVKVGTFVDRRVLILLLRAVDEDAVVRGAAPDPRRPFRGHDLAEVVPPFLRSGPQSARALGAKMW